MISEMRQPQIYFVFDSQNGKRHRAFSHKRPAFCGVVSKYSGWPHKRSYLASKGRQCRECAESLLNGPVVLVEGYYKPVKQQLTSSTRE